MQKALAQLKLAFDHLEKLRPSISRDVRPPRGSSSPHPRPTTRTLPRLPAGADADVRARRLLQEPARLLSDAARRRGARSRPAPLLARTTPGRTPLAALAPLRQLRRARAGRGEFAALGDLHSPPPRLPGLGGSGRAAGEPRARRGPPPLAQEPLPARLPARRGESWHCLSTRGTACTPPSAVLAFPSCACSTSRRVRPAPDGQEPSRE